MSKLFGLGRLFNTIGLLVCFLLSAIAQAQTPKGSDIWIGRLNIESKTPINDLVRVTNTNSYTNQPYFFDNIHLYYTQMHGENDSVQTDIHLFDLALGKDTNLTQSSESEYSATPVPNKPAFSVIRVNSEGKQELWELDLRGKPQQHLVPTVEPVGYQVWLNKTELLLFVLGEPHTLQRVDISKPENGGLELDSYIGASLYRYKQSPWFLYSKNYNNIPKPEGVNATIFTEIEQGNWLYAFNNKTGKVRRVASFPGSSEYFALTPSGYVLTSDGTQLLSRQIIEDEDKLKPLEKWNKVKIKQKECETGVSRIGVSTDGSMIALVCPRVE